jgi:hypothetical protein
MALETKLGLGLLIPSFVILLLTHGKKTVPQHIYGGAGVRGGKLLLIHDLGTRWGWVISVTPGRALPLGKGPPIPIGQEAGWAPEPVWTPTLEENPLALPGIEPRSHGRPVRSQTPYWLSYPGSIWHTVGLLFGRVISPSQRSLPTQDNTIQKHKENIHASSGIRTYDPSNKATKTYALDRATIGTVRIIYTYL